MANEFHFDEHSIVGGLFGLCIILIFTTLITYDITKKVIERFGKDENEESENTSIDIRIMIYIDLFCILIHAILLSFNFSFASSDTDCLLTKYILFVFHLIRCIMYLIFVRRISVIYGDTIFALSKLHEYILYFIIFIYSIPYISYTNWYFIDTYYNNTFGCVIKYKSNTQIYFLFNGILEIFIIIYCLYLFISPLYKLISHQEHKDLSYKLYNVMIKYFVLYLISIFSCLILILFSFNFSFGYNYSLIDGFINGIILILLHPIHNKLYKNYICCCFHSLCIKIFNVPIIYNQKHNIQNIKKIKVCDRSPTSPIEPIKQLEEFVLTPKMELNNSNENTMSIRNIMKEKVQKKMETNNNNNNKNIITITTHSPISPTPETTDIGEIYEWNINCKNIQIPSPSPPVQSILENEEMDMNMNMNMETNDHLTLKDIISLTSFKSVESINTIKSFQQLEQKKSNTLKLINFESTEL